MVCRHFSHAIYFEDAVAVVHLMDRYRPSSTLAIIDKLAVFFCICKQRDKKIARHGPSQQQHSAPTGRPMAGSLKRLLAFGWTSKQQRPQGDIGPSQGLHRALCAQ